MSDTCNKSKEDGIDQLANFAKSIIKAFILISVVVSIYYLKDKYLVEHMVGIPAISLIMFINRTVSHFPKIRILLFVNKVKKLRIHLSLI